MMTRKRFFSLIFVSNFVMMISGATYMPLGCYSDDLSGKSESMQTLTVDGCAGWCQSSGFPYAGLQSADECFCGLTYGLQGTSSLCNYTCGGTDQCGGYLSNSVYYAIDSSIQRSPIINSNTRSYNDSRSICVQNNGDLSAPNTQTLVNQLITLLTNSSITQAWIGLRRRIPVTGSYEWTDPTLSPAYSQQSYASYWTTGDSQQNDCVSLSASTGKFVSTSCSTTLPFVCNQQLSMTSGSVTTTPSGGGGGSGGASGQSVALYIVLPLFFICYGGSCILYCIHKIIKNCRHKKRSKMMLDEAQEDGGVGGRAPAIPYRPLSAGKRGVQIYPFPPPSSGVQPLQTKCPPVYMAQPDPGMKLKMEDSMDPLATARGVKISMPPMEPPPPPPKYDRQEEKRQRLLENAARESRMRREKEMEEGRPASRPFTAPKREPTPAAVAAPAQNEALEEMGSTVNLLGKGDKGKADEVPAAAAGEADEQGMSQMSINEILKMKMAQKADKKRQRKIITT